MIASGSEKIASSTHSMKVIMDPRYDVYALAGIGYFPWRPLSQPIGVSVSTMRLHVPGWDSVPVNVVV